MLALLWQVGFGLGLEELCAGVDGRGWAARRQYTGEVCSNIPSLHTFNRSTLTTVRHSVCVCRSRTSTESPGGTCTHLHETCEMGAPRGACPRLPRKPHRPFTLKHWARRP